MNIAFPLGSEDFRERLFEREPAIFRQAFSREGSMWPILDNALMAVDPTTDFVKLMHGARVEQATFVEEYMDIGVRRRRFRKDVLHERLAAGATLVVNRMDISSDAVRDICLQISRFAGAQAAANGYASFGGEPATDVHWDTHDVFVVQLEGRKHWQLYPPSLALPISSQTSTDRKGEVGEDCALEATVEAGDILYVPRGWWHRVAPVGTDETFHLAVGVHAPLMLDYVIWACANRFPAHLSMRHALLGRSIDESLVKQACDTLVEILSDPSTVRQFYEKSRSRERLNSSFRIGDLFSVAGAGDMDGERLQLNSRYAGASAEITLNGKIKRLADDEVEAVRAVLEHPDHTIGELVMSMPEARRAGLRETIRSLILADVVSPKAALRSSTGGPRA